MTQSLTWTIAVVVFLGAALAVALDYTRGLGLIVASGAIVYALVLAKTILETNNAEKPNR